jgi:hypothetical protein
MGLRLGIVANAPTGQEIGCRRRKAWFSTHNERNFRLASTLYSLHDPLHSRLDGRPCSRGVDGAVGDGVC